VAQTVPFIPDDLPETTIGEVGLLPNHIKMVAPEKYVGELPPRLIDKPLLHDPEKIIQDCGGLLWAAPFTGGEVIRFQLVFVPFPIVDGSAVFVKKGIGPGF
jgi:hypothetical protein